jgi:hypothetical protein
MSGWSGTWEIPLPTVISKHTPGTDLVRIRITTGWPTNYELMAISTLYQYSSRIQR